MPLQVALEAAKSPSETRRGNGCHLVLQVLRLFNLCDIGPAQHEADGGGGGATSSGGRPRSALPSPERSSRPACANAAGREKSVPRDSIAGDDAGPAAPPRTTDRVRSLSRDPSPAESAESGELASVAETGARENEATGARSGGAAPPPPRQPSPELSWRASIDARRQRELAASGGGVTGGMPARARPPGRWKHHRKHSPQRCAFEDAFGSSDPSPGSWWTLSRRTRTGGSYANGSTQACCNPAWRESFGPNVTV